MEEDAELITVGIAGPRSVEVYADEARETYFAFLEGVELEQVGSVRGGEGSAETSITFRSIDEEGPDGAGVEYELTFPHESESVDRIPRWNGVPVVPDPERVEAMKAIVDALYELDLENTLSDLFGDEGDVKILADAADWVRLREALRRFR